MYINKDVNINNYQIFKDIIDIGNTFKENIYNFNGPLDINFDFDSTYNVYNKNVFNIFCTYKKTIHKLFSEIKKQYIEIAKENNFDYESSKPYISAEQVIKASYDLNTKYDYGIDTIGEYIGIFPIRTDIKVKLNGSETVLKENKLSMFPTNTILEFIDIKNELLAIEFYISGLRNLAMQYYGKWIPLL